jgi:Fic family protein
MLFRSPRLPPEFVKVIESIDVYRERLRFATSDNLNRWNGFLARMAYARVIHSSNTMEGVNATFDDAIAAVDGLQPAGPQDENWLALNGHRDAMNYVIQLSKEPNFAHNEGTLLGLHFMMMKHDLSKNPGRYRPGPIHVTSVPSGKVVYEGPDAELVPGLMRELIDQLNAKTDAHVIVRAAMAHLNLTMIHPFRDGNGRMARALQTFVLAREGILDPRFSSIEEYVGRNSQEYYDVLGEVGRGRWHPEFDALAWIKFCLKAHAYQARTLLRRITETASLWEKLEEETKTRRLPNRSINALMDAATGLRIRNPAYRQDSEVSAQVAKRDLKMLVAEGLLVPRGERRGRVYLASPYLTELWAKCRVEDRQFSDPFAVAIDPERQSQMDFLARIAD